MTLLRSPDLGSRARSRVPLRWMRQAPPERLTPTWQQADPERIARSLAAATTKPTGGWLVAGASRDLHRDRSLVRTIAGREIVLWRGRDGAALAGDAACPHMGARLDGCVVAEGRVLCSWHGMSLGADTRPRWASIAAYDDGALVWVRAGDEAPTEAPALSARPDLGASLVSVIARPATCEPRDIVQNRLDPWHGAWLHPYAFSDLTVDDNASTDDRLVLDVAYRLGRSLAVPVRAEFTCPDSHSIVMTITEGEGAGSVVETHATPLTRPGSHPARTVMTEVVVAASPRAGFRVARALAPLVRRGMEASTHRLWVDDIAYAERLYEVRRRV